MISYVFWLFHHLATCSMSFNVDRSPKEKWKKKNTPMEPGTLPAGGLSNWIEGALTHPSESRLFASRMSDISPRRMHSKTSVAQQSSANNPSIRWLPCTAATVRTRETLGGWQLLVSLKTILDSMTPTPELGPVYSRKWRRFAHNVLFPFWCVIGLFSTALRIGVDGRFFRLLFVYQGKY